MWKALSSKVKAIYRLYLWTLPLSPVLHLVFFFPAQFLEDFAVVMAPRLCRTCSSIPADFWCPSHDLKEYAGEVSYRLQTLVSMRYEARKGCQLCDILLSSLHDVQQIDEYRPQGEEEVMYLRRARPFPERAIALGIGGSRGKHHVSRTFFSRIPVGWAGKLTEVHCHNMC